MSEESNHDSLIAEVEALRRQIDDLNRDFRILGVFVVLVSWIALVISLSGLNFIALIATIVLLVTLACLYSLEKHGL
jgi:hypothetical protein